MIEKYKITKLHDTLVEVYHTKVMKLFIIPIILVTATATESIVNSIPKSTHYSLLSTQINYNIITNL